MRPLTRTSGQVVNDVFFNKVCPILRSSTTRMTHNRVSIFFHRKQKCKSVLSQVRHRNANAATHLQQTLDVLTANVPRICIGLMEKRLFHRGGMSATWSPSLFSFVSCVTHANTEQELLRSKRSSQICACVCTNNFKSEVLLNLAVMKIMIQSRRDGDGGLNGSGTQCCSDAFKNRFKSL